MLSISCSKVEEKLKQLRDPIIAVLPENHDDQVCLVKCDSNDVFAEIPKSGCKEQMNSIDIADSSLNEEVSDIVSEKLKVVDVEFMEELNEEPVVVNNVDEVLEEKLEIDGIGKSLIVQIPELVPLALTLDAAEIFRYPYVNLPTFHP